MKIRKVKDKKSGQSSLAVESSGQWVCLVPLIEAMQKAGLDRPRELATDLIALLSASEAVRKTIKALCLEQGEVASGPLEALLPFQPAAYRDFMLYEQHYIDASRGFVKKFMPAAYRLATAYEKITGRVFPKFRPPRIWYEKPIYYMGNHLSFVTEGHKVAFPSYTKALDYELELGAIIVRPLKNASPEQAMAAIGGFVIVNDFSARDIQIKEMRSGFGPIKTKNFLNGMSQTVVTKNEVLPGIETLRGRVLINDREVASVSSDGMGHSLGQAVAYASLEEKIWPGELMALGTIPGGSGMENGSWVQAGDSLSLELPPIGTLTNLIV